MKPTASQRQDQLYALIEELVLCHSPSGDEREMDEYLLRTFPQAEQDEAGNIVVHLPGSGEPLALSAHKDEIGMMVHRLELDGRLRLGRLGGSFPWVYGEGVVDILGRHETITGILSFGSRHVSHQSPQKAQQLAASLQWEHCWVETFLSPAELADRGVQPGTRVVIGKHRKRPLRLGGRIASYTLDNKAAVAVLVLLAENLPPDHRAVTLIFSAQEEVGGLGALHYTQRVRPAEMIALDVTPVAPEYPVQFNDQPVLLSADSYSYYDQRFNDRLADCAQRVNIPLQRAVLNGFGSDASLVVKHGLVARVACLGFPTQNTHGYEIAELAALLHLHDLLHAYIMGG
ncbi:hypothetical protein [Candidatus Cyanaurora vandensis]|uniref:hypothetical protein n=1 Tax=Candidatus Cyanaurora vandensis TaxID=2714958 RepID=UPI00257CEE0C|nr:hypothetical protein [Candidatus Cyanaurora vandensis]